MSKLTFLTKYLSPLIWIVAIGIRLYGVSTPAQYYDMNTFHAWGNHLLFVGPRGFFDTIWSDYLPLPILTLAPVSWLSTLTGISFNYLFKLIYSALELILIALIARSTKKLPRWSIWLLLLSPAAIGDIAFWGQVDPIPSLLTLLSMTTLSPLLFGLAVAFKPIMILLAPLLWLLSVKQGKVWWRFPAISATTFFLTGIPTGGMQFIPHLFSRVLDQVGTYPYTTINAWNLWSLIPSNYWPSDTQTILGISPHFLGLLLFFTGLFIILKQWKGSNWNTKHGYRVAATILILFYTVTTRMHERHLFFGLPFLTLAAVFEPWLLVPLALLTATFTLNLWAAYYWVNHAQTWPVTPEFIAILSWVTTITALALTYIWNWPAWFSRLKQLVIEHKGLAISLVIAALLRLPYLSHPPVYIFDEVYHAFTAKEYLHNHIEAWEWWTTPPAGVAYEWTHPPVAKYGMVLGMLLFGEDSTGWRVGSAIFGLMSIIGIYLLTKAITGKQLTASLAALLVSIEGLHIAQSRIGMNDMYMLAFLVWSLYLAVKSRWKWAAILYGLALASKWSALYGLVPLTLIYVWQNVSTIFKVRFFLYHLLWALRLLLITAGVYVLTFAPFILAGHTWDQWIELHRQMWYYHTHLVATHGYQSTPREWIFSLRPVWYYVNYGEQVSNIYAQGNPLILWLGLVAFALQVSKLRSFKYLLFVVCYLVFTLPWLASPRIMFFYHYLPSAAFLCIMLAHYLTDLSASLRRTLLLLCVLSLVLISPMLYGFPMPQAYWNTLFNLIPSWK